MSVQVTYYVEMISSWCHWAEPAWAELKRRYAGQASFEWRIALLDAGGLPASREQCDWFYRRSGTIVRAPYMLNSGWFDPAIREYLAPNLVAEAAKDLGVADDRARLAIAEAGLREGRPIGRIEVAAEVASLATGLDADLLRAHAQTDPVLKRVRETTEEFHALKVTQRPTFVLESDIGDRAVFSGIWMLEPLVAAMESILSDERAYGSWAAHMGRPPGSL